jgi:hypothetical protein
MLRIKAEITKTVIYEIDEECLDRDGTLDTVDMIDNYIHTEWPEYSDLIDDSINILPETLEVV